MRNFSIALTSCQSLIIEYLRHVNEPPADGTDADFACDCNVSSLGFPKPSAKCTEGKRIADEIACISNAIPSGKPTATEWLDTTYSRFRFTPEVFRSGRHVASVDDEGRWAIYKNADAPVSLAEGDGGADACDAAAREHAAELDWIP